MADARDIPVRGNEKFVIKWVFSNLAGALLGYTIFFVILIFSGGLGSPPPPEVMELPQTKIESAVRSLLLLMPFFITSSTAQWVMLRARVKNVDFWIPASVLGYSVAIFIVFISPTRMMIGRLDIFLAFIPGLLLGLGIGVMQWLVLKNGIQDKSFQWLYITSLTYTLMNVGIGFLGIIGGLLGWLLGSLISGYWLKSRTTDLIFQ